MRLSIIFFSILVFIALLSCKAQKANSTNDAKRINILLTPNADPHILVRKYTHLSMYLIGPSSKIEHSYLYSYDDSKTKGEDILQSLVDMIQVLSATFVKVITKPRVDTNYKPD